MSSSPPYPEDHLAACLRLLGWSAEDDPELGETPERVASWLKEFDPSAPIPDLKTFETPAGSGPVVLRGLPFHSLCAHHLLPFFGTADVAYRPAERIVGLGAVPELLRALARRPQLQERLGQQVARQLQDQLGARGVAVRLTARQLCMEMRGACSPGSVETWSTLGTHTDELVGLVRRE